MACFAEEHLLSPEFSLLLSKTLDNTGHKSLFNMAFVFTIETGFIPISLADHFESVNSNVKLAKMINDLPLDSFWYQANNVFTAYLLMSNQLCHLTGVSLPNSDSLIITLSHSNMSKCILLEANKINLNEKSVCLSQLSLKFKNLVSVPIKCSVLEITTGLYPGLCGIPEELILLIMKQLSEPDLFMLKICCKKMNLVAKNNPSLWKKFVIEDFPSYFSMGNWINDWRTTYYSIKECKRALKQRGS